MWLLNTSSLVLEEYLDDPPSYAILSHTWEKDEISFKDVVSNTAGSRTGYAKVKSFCNLAASKGYRHCWIDTCCIDKSSSAELSEAINSMFAYYENSGACYVYLNVPVESAMLTNEDLQSARWTYRGWTLQELIAPSHLEFYDLNWKFCGSRYGNASVLANVTGIDYDLLVQVYGDMNLRRYSIATRMSWAARRKTTRKEDMAYCLFGIFDVHLAPLYGEGSRRAFERLQGEIIKGSTDLSFLAWGLEDFVDRQCDHSKSRRWSGMATGPQDFEGGACITNSRVSRLDPFHITNKGLCLTLPLVRQPSSEGPIAVLKDCYKTALGTKTTLIGIRIFAFDPDDNFYYRRRGESSVVCLITDDMLKEASVETFYLATRDIPDRKPRGRGGYN